MIESIRIEPSIYDLKLEVLMTTRAQLEEDPDVYGVYIEQQ